jgi:glycosyltransferase involved in cell wall biosynthesis
MVGKLSKRRNIPLLIEAFARADVPERLVIVGPDYLRLDVPRLAREAGAGDRVDWIEYAPMERLAQLYRAATAYVLPTLHEGFSLTIVEAMACGTPAIVFDHAGLEPEVKAAAAVVEPQGLTAALERISRDKVWRGELSSRSLECARLFRWEATARETMAILAETAERLQRR